MCLTKIQSTFYLALMFSFISFSSIFPTVTPVFNLVAMFCLSFFFLETSLTAVANSVQSMASEFYLLVIILIF